MSRTHRVAEAEIFGVMLIALLAASCSGSFHPSNRFHVRNTAQAVLGDSPVEVRGDRTLYLADERTSARNTTGVDLNGDGDIDDQVAFLLDMRTGESFDLGVAAQRAQFVGDRIFAVVLEAQDSIDWNGDGDMDDTVLLDVTQTPVLADTLQTDEGLVTAVFGDRIFFRSATVQAPDATNLAFVDAHAPGVVTPVPSEDGAAYRPRVLGLDEGLLFAWLDETIEQADLNGDGDASDAFVAALVDTTPRDGADVLLRNTGLAVRDAQIPFRARAAGRSGGRTDWLVAFPVSEPATGGLEGGGFNDPSRFEPQWLPPQCDRTRDDDLNDDVLFWLPFVAWSEDPLGNPPVDTGLVSTRRVVALIDPVPFVGTISRESDEGMCDLNGDGDTDDSVVRWVEAAMPVLPFRDPRQIVSIVDVRGGSRGLAELSDAFVAVVSETSDDTDHDGSGGAADDLVGWVRPVDGAQAAWIYRHRLDHDGLREETAVGSDWMEVTPDHASLLTTLRESVYGRVIDEDGDDDDLVASRAQLSSGELRFVWDTLAVRANNAGLVLAGDDLFYRADEAASDVDGNRDGDKSDRLLVTAGVKGAPRRILGTLNDVDPSTSVFVDTDPAARPTHAVFVADERAARADYDGDGDKTDLVLRWFAL